MAVYNTQTNTKSGDIKFVATASLDGKEGLLVKLTSTNVVVPAAITDDPIGVVVEGDDGALGVTVRPLSPYMNVRAYLTGTCAQGDRLVLDDGSTGTWGNVRKLPAGTGTAIIYRILGIAEEAGVAGQLVRFRPYPQVISVT